MALSLVTQEQRDYMKLALIVAVMFALASVAASVLSSAIELGNIFVFVLVLGCVIFVYYSGLIFFTLVILYAVKNENLIFIRDEKIKKTVEVGQRQDI